jgi:hypothetical protein
MNITRDPEAGRLLLTRPELVLLAAEAEELAGHYIAPAAGARWTRPAVSSEQIELVVSTMQPLPIAYAQLGALIADPRWEEIIRASRGAILVGLSTIGPKEYHHAE